MQWPTWQTFKVLWHIVSITSIVIHSQYHIQSIMMHSEYYIQSIVLYSQYYIQSIVIHSEYYETFTVLHSRHEYTFTVLLCKHEMKHPLTQQLEYWARRSWNRMENTQTISQLFWSDNMHCYSFIAMNPYL